MGKISKVKNRFINKIVNNDKHTAFKRDITEVINWIFIILTEIRIYNKFIMGLSSILKKNLKERINTLYNKVTHIWETPI